MKTELLIVLGLATISFLSLWIVASHAYFDRPSIVQLAIGFGTNFLDTLGIGSYATTTSAFRALGIVPDEVIPGTLNVGHTIPTILEAFIYVSIIQVSMRTLVLMIAASVCGTWIGAGIVSAWPRRKIQVGMGIALFAAAALMLLAQRGLVPAGGDALQLTGTRLGVGLIGNFVFGALMTLGIGLYAPCMILVSLLGMDPKVSFPIMMASCAFLMPVGGARFILRRRVDTRAALGLAGGGIPGVLLAAFVVGAISLTAVRWLVIAVVGYTAVSLIRAADSDAQPAPAVDAFLS